MWLGSPVRSRRAGLYVVGRRMCIGQNTKLTWQSAFLFAPFLRNKYSAAAIFRILLILPALALGCLNPFKATIVPQTIIKPRPNQTRRKHSSFCKSSLIINRSVTAKVPCRRNLSTQSRQTRPKICLSTKGYSKQSARKQSNQRAA